MNQPDTRPVTPADYHHDGVITHAERQALQLRYANGLNQQPALSYTQVANALGITRHAARDRIRSATTKIARHHEAVTT